MILSGKIHAILVLYHMNDYYTFNIYKHKYMTFCIYNCRKIKLTKINFINEIPVYQIHVYNFIKNCKNVVRNSI